MVKRLIRQCKKLIRKSPHLMELMCCVLSPENCWQISFKFINRSILKRKWKGNNCEIVPDWGGLTKCHLDVILFSPYFQLHWFQTLRMWLSHLRWNGSAHSPYHSVIWPAGHGNWARSLRHAMWRWKEGNKLDKRESTHPLFFRGVLPPPPFFGGKLEMDNIWEVSCWRWLGTITYGSMNTHAGCHY